MGRKARKTKMREMEATTTKKTKKLRSSSRLLSLSEVTAQKCCRRCTNNKLLLLSRLNPNLVRRSSRCCEASLFPDYLRVLRNPRSLTKELDQTCWLYLTCV